MRRPRGITIVAVILAVLGTISVLFGVLAVVAPALDGGASPVGADQVALLEAFGIAALVLGTGQLIVAWALWHLKKWAWWLTIVLQGISVLEGLAAMAFTDVTSVDAAVFSSLIVSVAILGYFLTKGVRGAFGYGPVFGE